MINFDKTLLQESMVKTDAYKHQEESKQHLATLTQKHEKYVEAHTIAKLIMSNIKQITITKPTSIKYQGMFNTNPTILKLQVGQKIVNINGSFIYHDGSKNGLELDNITVANFVSDNQDKVKIYYKPEDLF
jgi:ABC-type transporter MlaC component